MSSIGKFEELDKEYPPIDLIPSDVWNDLEKVQEISKSLILISGIVH